MRARPALRRNSYDPEPDGARSYSLPTHAGRVGRPLFALVRVGRADNTTRGSVLGCDVHTHFLHLDWSSRHQPLSRHRRYGTPNFGTMCTHALTQRTRLAARTAWADCPGKLVLG